MEEEINYLPAASNLEPLNRDTEIDSWYLYCVCLVSDEIIESNVQVTMAKWDTRHKNYCCN